MMARVDWEGLDNKEKDLCSENDIEPQDYLLLKRQIALEATKNRAITTSMMADRSKEMRTLRDKVPVIYDFWVKFNLIPPQQQ